MNRLQRWVPRALTGLVREVLEEAPATILTGARQTGKSTLIRELLDVPALTYRNLDDIDVLEQARSRPDSLLQGAGLVVLDEIQRIPELLLANLERSGGRSPDRIGGGAGRDRNQEPGQAPTARPPGPPGPQGRVSRSGAPRSRPPYRDRGTPPRREDLGDPPRRSAAAPWSWQRTVGGSPG